ncbi:SRPBCC family protein [Pedobacter metabolipauper]|uniref:Putative membrane protein n=1 Tax=Pedobacter metabolipauper TaxID=425513 RepID=A0A4R6SYQ2_9SPHI|nr:SRPBCC family protein [Pedobacter metabolipauper]TDQ11172.1 putative membrane protein [Pedobacter metabolipauper]
MNNELTTKIIGGLKELSINKTGKENIDQGERALSVVAGSYLLYKSLKNLIKHPFLGLQGAAAGGLLIYRGATGVCPIYTQLGKDTTDPEAINITEDIVVNAPREKVYEFWRNLSNLPKFMTHLKSISEISDTESHWVANTPGNLVDLKWNAEITREDEGSYIGWQSVEGSMVDNAGKVEFRDTLNGTGTELHIEIDYFPPAGSVGRGITSLFNGLFEKMIREDIQNFKAYAEAEDFKLYAGLTA